MRRSIIWFTTRWRRQQHGVNEMWWFNCYSDISRVDWNDRQTWGSHSCGEELSHGGVWQVIYDWGMERDTTLSKSVINKYSCSDTHVSRTKQWSYSMKRLSTATLLWGQSWSDTNDSADYFIPSSERLNFVHRTKTPRASPTKQGSLILAIWDLQLPMTASSSLEVRSLPSMTMKGNRRPSITILRSEPYPQRQAAVYLCSS